MTTTTRDMTFTREVIIKASPEKIFAALTKPDQLTKWWGADDVYRVQSMENDLRVGGQWTSSGEDANGQKFTTNGVYLKIDPPHALEYTWNYDWDDNRAETTVRFDLEPIDGATRVSVTHSGFVDVGARDGHRQGWMRVLGWLAQYVE